METPKIPGEESGTASQERETISKEAVMTAHPSICYNRDKGYVGCAEYLRKGETADFIFDAKELTEGWVDMRAAVFGPKSGIITNLQLMTLEVKKCAAFSSED